MLILSKMHIKVLISNLDFHIMGLTNKYVLRWQCFVACSFTMVMQCLLNVLTVLPCSGPSHGPLLQALDRVTGGDLGGVVAL